MPREDFRLKLSDYGFGLEVVVVVDSVFVSVFVSGLGAVVRVFFSVVVTLSVAAFGFPTVVLTSVFFSAGAAGTTVSVFCSHAPRSAVLARMQINFFIVWISCGYWDKA
jgi:hypothetical protein